MKICFANQKGGVGKTTLAALFGCALAAAGRRVAFQDFDAQQTLGWWAAHVGEMPMHAAGKGEPAEIVVADTPGALGKEFDRAVRDADRIALVTEPSVAALHSTARTVPVIRKAAPRAKIFLLYNRVRAGTLSARQDLDALAGRIGVPALATRIPLRSAYEQFMAAGWGSLRPLDRDVIVRAALDLMTA